MLRCAEVVTIATLWQSTALCHDLNVIRNMLWLYKLFNSIQFCNELIEMLEVCAQVQFWSWREWCWTMCRCLHSTAVCWQPIVDYYSRPTEGTESECPWGENTSSSWTWWRTDTRTILLLPRGLFYVFCARGDCEGIPIKRCLGMRMCTCKWEDIIFNGLLRLTNISCHLADFFK